MPLVGGGNAINIDFTAQADDLVAEVKRINKSFDDFKAKQKETASAAEESSKKIAAAAKKQSQSWTEVRSAYSTVLDVMRAGKAVFDFAKEGAQLEFIKKKFENLSESIGTTSDVLLNDLRSATQGMYSDMELMASATDFVGLGLANTREEAVRLATVSAGLNMNMNQLVLTLTNMTTMRFDALGVRVDGFKEKVNALKASGMDADAAFKEAFLQQAEAQLELVGNAADTSAGAFMRFEAQWANTTNTIKQSAGEAFTPMLQSFNDMNSVITKEADQLEMLGRVGLIPTGEYSKQAAEKHESLLLQLDKGALMTKFYSNRLPELAANLDEVAEATGMTEEESKKYMSVLDKMSSETERFTEKNADLTDKLTELEKKLSGERKGSKAYKDIQGEIDDTKTAINELAAEHAKASKSIMFDLISQQAAAEGFKNISVEALAAMGEEWGVLAKGSGDATSQMISQANAWSDALSGVPGQIKTIAEMWANLRDLAKSGVTLTANVVSQATGGAMGGQNTQTLCFTGDTPVTMADFSTKHIKDIVIGDKVISYDTANDVQVITTVIQTFEHSENESGTLIIINGSLKVTTSHLLWNGFQWRAAGNFVKGDSLFNLDGSMQRVRTIRQLAKREKVYNIHVDHNCHNYFAGGVLVHNAKSSDVTTQWQGGTVGSFAGGGKGGGWGIVGDKQGGGWVDGVSELVYGNFKVYPSKQAKGILKSGALGKVPGFAFGGDMGGYTSAPPIAPVYTPSMPRVAPSKSGGGSDPISSAMQFVETQAVDMQASTQNAVVQMAQVTQQMTQSILNSNAQNQVILEDIAAILRHENPRAVGKAVAYEVAKGS